MHGIEAKSRAIVVLASWTQGEYREAARKMARAPIKLLAVLSAQSGLMLALAGDICKQAVYEAAQRLGPLRSGRIHPSESRRMFHRAQVRVRIRVSLVCINRSALEITTKNESVCVCT
jgi:hypothetical protein